VTLDGVSGTIHQLGLFESHGDGLRCAGDLSGLGADFVLIAAPAGDGLVLDGVSGCVLRHVTVEDPGGYDVSVRGGGQATLIDATFDDGNVSVVDAGSQLTRAWSAHLVVLAENDDPLEGVSASLVDLLGNTVVVGTTDAGGELAVPDLVEWVRTSGASEAHTPHTIVLEVAGWDTVLSYTADHPDLIVVKWMGISTGTPPPGGLPAVSRLVAIVPNPFNPRAEVRFDLAAAGPVELEIYDALGRRVRTLQRAWVPAGSGVEIWDGTDSEGREAASGVYFVRLKAGRETSWRKGVLLR
jgi:hypothetical protein